MVKVEVRGVSGLIANVRAMDPAAGREIRTTMRTKGVEQHSRTQAECPVDKGFMQANTRLDFSPNGQTYTVGYRAEDFTGAGEPFYPPYVILGTSRQAANDFLFRVHEQMSPELTRAVGNALRRSLQRFRR